MSVDDDDDVGSELHIKISRAGQIKAETASSSTSTYWQRPMLQPVIFRSYGSTEASRPRPRPRPRPLTKG